VTSEAEAVSVRTIGWGLRIGYAFLGLIAGNAAIAAYFFSGYFWALLLNYSSIAGLPSRNILIGYAGMELIYGTFSFLGWLVVGLPIILLLPVRILNRLPWLAILLIAAAIGIAAFFPIYLLLNGGHLTSDALPFRRTGMYWFLALLASMAGFPTYCWLIRRRTVPVTGTCNP
jgi:hypothetical protein